MKSLREQLAELFGVQEKTPDAHQNPRVRDDTSIKKKAPSLKKCPKCGVGVKSTRLKNHLKSAHGVKKRVKRNKSYKRNIKVVSPPPSLSLEEIHRAYHPESKKRDRETPRESEQPTMHYRTRKNNENIVKCVQCGSPAMQGDNICRQCSSE